MVKLYCLGHTTVVEGPALEDSKPVMVVVYCVQLHFTATTLMCALDLITRIVIHYSSHIR